MTKPSLQEVIGPETQHNTHFHHLKNPFSLEIQPRSRFIFPLITYLHYKQSVCISVCQSVRLTELLQVRVLS